MVPYLGDFAVDATVYIPFNTFDSNDPSNSATITTLLNTDVHIHKDGGTTQRTSSSGETLTIDFDSVTGNHLLAIDTSDNTDAGFYAAGSDYMVRIEGGTVDGGNINAWIGHFSIENRAGIPEQVWDKVLNASTHNIANSAGRRLRQLQESGSAYGGAIWIDTVNGTAGTTSYENGTSDNPVDTIADANTLASALGISRFEVAPGSSITFAASQNNQIFTGRGWTLALGSQSIDGTSIIGATVSGVGTNTSGMQRFIDCHMNASTLPGDTHLLACHIANTITMGEAGDYFFDQCFSAVAGVGTPAVDWGAAVGSSNLSVRHYSGGIEMQNMEATAGTDTASIEGDGQVVLNANCAGGTVAIRGNMTLTDNSGSVTLSDDARLTISEIADQVWDESQGDHTTGGSFGETATEIASILADTGTDGVVIATATAQSIADEILKRDMDQVEASAALHSLCTAVLKAVSRVRDNAGTLETYRTDGTTLHMSQTVTTDATLDPVDELTAGT